MSGSAVQTGKRATYAAYKPSGLPWLGDVPEHWEELAFKRLGDFQAGAGFPNDEQGLDDDELPFYKVSDTNLPGNEVFMNSHNNAVSRETALRLRAYVFPKDTVVFAKVGAALLLNKRRILTRPSCIDNNMMGFIRKSCDRNWGYYWMCSLDLGELANPGAVPSINEGQIREIRVPVPPLNEQKAIAAFLDRETARIDALIEKKRRQIELLHEKRAALISHAVTKGLDPNAPMKDSGIDWLGQIPAHWELFRAKILFREVDERSTSGEEELLTVSHKTGVTRRSEKEVTMFMAESLVGYKKCEPGDFVINTMWAWMGAMGFASESGIVSPSYNVYRFRKNSNDPWFYDYLFRTGKFVAEVICYSKGVWTSRLRLYPESFFEIRLPCPPKVEQKKIVASIKKETGHYDVLRSRIEDSITKLREYRTALISAAVTGKIDVRGVAPMRDTSGRVPAIGQGPRP